VRARRPTPASRRPARIPASPAHAQPGGWPRLEEVAKKWWKVVLAIAGAIGGLTGYVATIDSGRHARTAAIDATISALRGDPSEDGRNRKLDSLGAGALAEHLEPRIIQGLQDFVRERTHGAMTCPPAKAQGAPLARRHLDVNHAFRLVARLQAPNRGHHSYPDRVIDAFLVWWHGEPDFQVKPLALDGSDLRGDSLGGLSMRSGSFVGSCLTGTHFDRAILDSARFDSATLDSADFTQASMRSSSLAGAHGSGVAFDRVDLTDANFNATTLRMASFFGANLSCATFGNAHLEGSYFSTASATWTFFGGAHLAGARQWDEITDFRGAYVGSIHDLSASLLSLAHARGALSDTMPQAGWFESRIAQLRPGGECTRKNAAKA
jgi:uncharacterized protein YjbI with pentapeptide repeats